jgi:hypothetical protein
MSVIVDIDATIAYALVAFVSVSAGRDMRVTCHSCGWSQAMPTTSTAGRVYTSRVHTTEGAYKAEQEIRGWREVVMEMS